MVNFAVGVAKRGTINRLLSKALNNNEVSSYEFDIILSDREQYNSLKEQVRAKMLRQPSSSKIVDVQKLEKDIRSRLEDELIKKNNRPPRFELTLNKRLFHHLHIIRS